jgi:serpin B
MGVGVCNSHAIPADQAKLALANSDFGFNLLTRLAAGEPGSNIFISPYSASTALQMVATGAEGATLTQMNTALCTSNLQESVIESGAKEIAAIVNARNTNFVLTTANAVWYREGLPIFQNFITANRNYFGAKVEGLDFDEPSAVNLINEWASEETHGKIEKIINGPVPPEVDMFLANAVYFLGSWQYPFSPSLTVGRVFSLKGGEQKTVPMMQQTAFFRYAATSSYQAVRLPYKGGDLAMYVLLPNAGSSVETLLSTLNGETWQQVTNGMRPENGNLSLPKLNITYSASLIPALEAMGMRTAFTPGANFSKISSLKPLYIGAVEQQALVEVNEAGTVAAPAFP